MRAAEAWTDLVLDLVGLICDAAPDVGKRDYRPGSAARNATVPEVQVLKITTHRSPANNEEQHRLGSCADRSTGPLSCLNAVARW